ncbi:hypothetical protein ONZ45_g6934 [Pleurotus djamor]|nr:hypothetical protein ONZ45_g6934 [Pleurotus djamor]
MATTLGKDDPTLKDLLADPDGMKATINFINRTKRFGDAYGKLEKEAMAEGVAARKKEAEERKKGSKKGSGRGRR